MNLLMQHQFYCMLYGCTDNKIEQYITEDLSILFRPRLRLDFLSDCHLFLTLAGHANKSPMGKISVSIPCFPHKCIRFSILFNSLL